MDRNCAVLALAGQSPFRIEGFEMSEIGLPSVPQCLDASKTGPWVPNFLMGKLSMMLALF